MRPTAPTLPADHDQDFMPTPAASRLTPAEIDALMRTHERMIWWVANRVMGVGAKQEDIEDCAAELRLHFLKSARRYDPSRGVKFSTYAMRLAWGCAKRWKKKNSRSPRGRKLLSLDHSSGDDTTLTHQLSVPTPEPKSEPPLGVWSSLAKVLTPREVQMIILRFVDGLDHKSIGQRHGCSDKNVCYIVRRSLRKIREKLPELRRHLEA